MERLAKPMAAWLDAVAALLDARRSSIAPEIPVPAQKPDRQAYLRVPLPTIRGLGRGMTQLKPGAAVDSGE